MPTAQIGISLSGAGETISRNITRTADGGSSRTVTLPTGKPGTLTTRTDNDTGTVTLESGHGITTGQKVDVHWDGGVQYNVTVGTVAGTSVPIDAGLGDNLPIATTAVVVTPRVEINAAIDGDNLQAIAMEAGYLEAVEAQAHVQCLDASNDSIAAVKLSANIPKLWDVAGDSDNPFTGDPITKLWASNGSATVEAELKVIWIEDTTP